MTFQGNHQEWRIASMFLFDWKKSEKTKTLFDYVCTEAYETWKSEHPQRQIGKSQFAKLRSNFVLLTSELPRNICVCKIHENFIQCLKALHRFNSIFPLYYENFYVKNWLHEDQVVVIYSIFLASRLVIPVF